MFTPVAIVIAWIVSFAAALLQGVMGFGYALLSVPILTLVDPAFTPIPQLLAALPLTVAAAWRERTRLEMAGVGWVIAGRIPGAFLGAFVLTIVTERTLGLIIAIVVLIAVGAIAAGASIRLTRSSRVITGVISGFSGTTSAIGGPPLALLYRDAAGAVIRSSLGAIITIGLLVNLAALAVAGAMTADDLRAAAWLVIPTLAGFAASGRIMYQLEGDRIRQGILLVSAAASVLLLVRVMSG